MSNTNIEQEEHYFNGSVAILGIDGSGKSTLSSKVAKSLSSNTRKTSLISDNLESFRNGESFRGRTYISESIRRLFRKISANAKSLKLYKIPKLIELMLRNVLHRRLEKDKTIHNIILDGSPLLNLAAWSYLYKKTLDPDNLKEGIKFITTNGKGFNKSHKIFTAFPELKWLKKSGMAKLKLPDKVIFLDITPESAMERIRRRGKSLQVHETEEKLGKLREAYHLVCGVINDHLGIPVLILTKDQDLQSNLHESLEFIKNPKTGIHE